MAARGPWPLPQGRHLPRHKHRARGQPRLDDDDAKGGDAHHPADLARQPPDRGPRPAAAAAAAAAAVVPLSLAVAVSASLAAAGAASAAILQRVPAAAAVLGACQRRARALLLLPPLLLLRLLCTLRALERGVVHEQEVEQAGNRAAGRRGGRAGRVRLSPGARRAAGVPGAAAVRGPCGSGSASPGKTL